MPAPVRDRKKRVWLSGAAFLMIVAMTFSRAAASRRLVVLGHDAA
jgi:hypothetical protein